MTAADGHPVSMKLTAQQASVLEYILERTQEDSDFFEHLGAGDNRVSRVFQRAVGQILVKVKQAPTDSRADVPVLWLWDQLERIGKECPFDGRTQPGRAWLEALRRVRSVVSSRSVE